MSSPSTGMEALVHDLTRLKADRALLLVGVDGGGGSGKSTLAHILETSLPEASHVHIDDFYLPSAVRRRGTVDGFFDWKRLRRQVILPLLAGLPAAYERYDWPTDVLAETVTIPARGFVIVEGVSCTRPELRNAYDLRIWVEAPQELRLARGIGRDGEESTDNWNYWMAVDAHYAETMKPWAHAHVVIDGAVPMSELAVIKADPEVVPFLAESVQRFLRP